MPYEHTGPRPRYDELPDIVSIKLAAAYLGVKSQSVYKQIKVGRLQSVNFGRRVLVPKGALPSPEVAR